MKNRHAASERRRAIGDVAAIAPANQAGTLAALEKQ
jgi:hypothetical protein